MASPFTALQAWLAAAGGEAACVTLTDTTSTSAERGLVTAVDVDAGATLVRVPLSAACTPTSALRCPGVRALLRGDLDRLKRVLCSQDVPHPSILTLSCVVGRRGARPHLSSPRLHSPAARTARVAVCGGSPAWTRCHRRDPVQ